MSVDDRASAAAPSGLTESARLMLAMPSKCQALLQREPALARHCLDPRHYDAVRACASSLASARLAAELYHDRPCFGERSCEPNWADSTFGTGLPVDCAASAVVDRMIDSADDAPPFDVLHLVGCSRVRFGEIVQWVGSAGYPLQFVEGARAWHARFIDRLGDDAWREMSPAALLEDWHNACELLGVGPAEAATPLALPAPGRWGMQAAIDERLVHKTLADLVLRGALKSPVRPSPQR